MAGDWIRIRANLTSTPQFMRFTRACSLSREQGLEVIYRLASWFASHGKYGRIYAEPNVASVFVGVPGAAEALIAVGWMRKMMAEWMGERSR